MAARRRFLSLAAAILVLPTAAALGWALSYVESDPPSPLTPGAYEWKDGALPDVTFTTLSGEPVTIDVFRGQVVVLNFWATWCPPCLREIPELVLLHEALYDEEVAIVGVAAQSGKADAVEKFVGAHDMSYPIWMVDDASLDAFGVVGFPFTFLIDREGEIRMRYVGPQSFERLLTDIEALLEEDGAGANS